MNKMQRRTATGISDILGQNDVLMQDCSAGQLFVQMVL